jgi:hypothetical protein
VASFGIPIVLPVITLAGTVWTGRANWLLASTNAIINFGGIFMYLVIRRGN